MKGISRWLTVEGLNLERFIRRAGEEGISLERLKRRGRRLRLLAKEEDMPRLLALGEQGGWACWPGRRAGLGRRLDTLLARWMLPAASLAGLAAVCLGMQVMWQVEIIGAGSYQADVEAFLSGSGIAAPMWKKQVRPAALREQLEWRYPRIAWVECGWRGGTLQVRLVEGVPAGESLSISGAGDVVAARGGIVDSVITAAGTAQVKPGEVIAPGQVLIAGQERGENGELHPVMARGRVLARVWDKASIRMLCVETDTAYTGRRQQTWAVQGPWFALARPAPSPYESQDVRRTTMALGGLFFPFTVVMEERTEVTCVPRQRDMHKLRQEAGAAALRALQKKLEFDDDLVDKWVDYCMIDGEVLEAVAYGERLMDVALPRRNQ